MMKKLRIPKIVPDYQNREKIILRDFLALERTTLANERTLFAYIRTSLYLILGGIAFLKMESLETVQWLAYLSFGISLIMIIYGIVRYFKLKHKLQKFYDEDSMKSFEEHEKQESV
jgi:putative membrane protein